MLLTLLIISPLILIIWAFSKKSFGSVLKGTIRAIIFILLGLLALGLIISLAEASPRQTNVFIDKFTDNPFNSTRNVTLDQTCPKL